jgi:hypothetical protein
MDENVLSLKLKGDTTSKKLISSAKMDQNDSGELPFSYLIISLICCIA